MLSFEAKKVLAEQITQKYTNAEINFFPALEYSALTEPFEEDNKFERTINLQALFNAELATTLWSKVLFYGLDVELSDYNMNVMAILHELGHIIEYLNLTASEMWASSYLNERYFRQASQEISMNYGEKGFENKIYIDFCYFGSPNEAKADEFMLNHMNEWIK